ncbi:AraC family transcriptional regulator [Curvibacter sp. CHRR-16]|uniref:AraC family transcriptional regulator n=1 Tax=Curvibacter sp. CHRR-16 TaxID=2835872 RepID=UPI001BDA0657|nr:AraC family transcriptional regulator [Curvibacter sp. CHRR-16]MBT0570172.1 AraC family transcriptional regulator [Curvibacter sp. CHRR-16]
MALQSLPATSTAPLTASRSWGLTLLQAAEQQRCKRETLLQHAGVPDSVLDVERWPIDDVTRLWRSAAQLTGDTGFGLRAGMLVGPASFNVVGFLLQSSATLRDALGQVQRFQQLISDGGRFQLLPTGDAVWLIYHPQQGDLVFSPHQIEAVLAAVVRFATWLLQSQWAPLQAQFSHPAQTSSADYRMALGCGVEFEQGFNGLLVPNALLDAPLPQADAQLAQLHAGYAQAKLQAIGTETRQDTGSRLRAWLASQLGNGAPPPSRAAAAHALGMTERMMRRRLAQTGQSYRGVVDSVLSQSTLAALRTTRLSLSTLAGQFGFHDASSLHRAVVRWTGQTPSGWRHSKSSDDTQASVRLAT